jgi:hypothetical protein
MHTLLIHLVLLVFISTGVWTQGFALAGENLRTLFDTGCCYVAQAGLKLSILLPLPPEMGSQVFDTTPGYAYIFDPVISLVEFHPEETHTHTQIGNI